MEIDTGKLKTKIGERLNLYLDELASVKLKQTTDLFINSKEFRTPEGISEILTQIDNTKTPTIYRFSIKSSIERRKLVNIYRDFHSINKQKDRGKDRLNVSRFNDTNSETLYLGSKMKNPRSRIKQHLGNGYFRTFSLHLNKWSSGLDYQLKLQIFNIQTTIELEFQRSFIELIEQELWEEFKPIFGKKSGL